MDARRAAQLKLDDSPCTYGLSTYAMFVRLQWSLTGRSEEMGVIEAALSASDVRGVVICGAAGVGKSRVAREALGVAASKNAKLAGPSASPAVGRYHLPPSRLGWSSRQRIVTSFN